MLSKVSLPSLTFWKASFSKTSNHIIPLIARPNEFIQAMIFTNQQHEFQRFFTRKYTPDPTPDIFFDNSKSKDYETRCEQGDIEAIKIYVPYLIKGTNGLQSNLEKAAHYCKIGYDQDDPKCKLLYGILLYHGKGVSQDFSKAFEIFKEASKEGNAESEYYLFQCYYHGNGVEKDENKALNFLKSSADKGFPLSCLTYGLQLSHKNDENRYKYYKTAAEHHDIDGEFLYGLSIINNKIKPPEPIEKGVKYVKIAADKGQKEAQRYYGFLLEEGKLVDQNIDLALQYYKKAADKDDAKSCYRYSALLCTKKLNEDELEQVYIYMKKAADKGISKAQSKLGFLIKERFFVTTSNLQAHTDLNEAIQYLKESIKQGDTFGMTVYASIIENENPNKAEDYYKMAVEKEPKNYPLKQYIDFLERNNRNETMRKYIKIGCENNDSYSIYMKSYLLYQDDKIDECFAYLKRGVEMNNTDSMILYARIISKENPNKAHKLYKMAIEKGNDKALFYLALDISNGNIVTENGPSDAFKYMEMAANKYVKRASAYCFDWLLRGVNCKKNIEKGMKYLKRAAIDENDAECQYWYGYFNLFGQFGLKINDDIGLKFLEMAAEQKYPKAFYLLGSLYMDGSIVQKDEKKAAYLFKIGADLGDPESINFYSSCLLTGDGVDKDEYEAFYYLEKGVELKHPVCAFNLGLMYMNGVVVKKDSKKGMELLKFASSRGIIEANKAMNYYKRKA